MKYQNVEANQIIILEILNRYLEVPIQTTTLMTSSTSRLTMQGIAKFLLIRSQLDKENCQSRHRMPSLILELLSLLLLQILCVMFIPTSKARCSLCTPVGGSLALLIAPQKKMSNMYACLLTLSFSYSSLPRPA